MCPINSIMVFFWHGVTFYETRIDLIHSHCFWCCLPHSFSPPDKTLRIIGTHHIRWRHTSIMEGIFNKKNTPYHMHYRYRCFPLLSYNHFSILLCYLVIILVYHITFLPFDSSILVPSLQGQMYLPPQDCISYGTTWMSWWYW